MGKDKTAPLTEQQVSVRAGGTQRSADPLLGKLFCTGGDGGTHNTSYFAARSLISTNGGYGEGRGLGASPHPRPGKQQSGGEQGGLRHCPGVTGSPGKASVGVLGRAPVATRAPGDRPQPTPFPTGWGGGGCSAGSQSRDQCYKAHPLGGGKGGGGWKHGTESQSTFYFYGAVESSSSLN